MLQPFIYCGVCDNCAKGEYGLCRSYKMVGCGYSGGMSDYLVVPERTVYKIKDDMSLLDASLVQIGAFAFGSVMESGLKPGNTCMITGAGNTGLIAVQASRNFCATTIIVSDRSPFRLEMARKMGATHTINVHNENVKTRVMEITNGLGFDFVYDTIGIEASMNEAIEAVRYLGKIILVLNDYIFDEHIPISRSMFMKKQVTLQAYNQPYIKTYPLMIEMTRTGIMNVKPLITKIISLDDVVEEGFHAVARDSSQLKIVIRVNDLE